MFWTGFNKARFLLQRNSASAAGKLETFANKKFFHSEYIFGVVYNQPPRILPIFSISCRLNSTGNDQ